MRCEILATIKPIPRTIFPTWLGCKKADEQAGWLIANRSRHAVPQASSTHYTRAFPLDKCRSHCPSFPGIPRQSDLLSTSLSLQFHVEWSDWLLSCVSGSFHLAWYSLGSGVLSQMENFSSFLICSLYLVVLKNYSHLCAWGSLQGVLMGWCGSGNGTWEYPKYMCSSPLIHLPSPKIS